MSDNLLTGAINDWWFPPVAPPRQVALKARKHPEAPRRRREPVRHRINGCQVLFTRAATGWWVRFEKHQGGSLAHGWVWMRTLRECRQWAHRATA